MDLELSAPHVPSLHAWLQAHKGTIRRLRLALEHEEGPATGMFLLGALAGGVLASLSWGPEPRNEEEDLVEQPFELGSWVLALPHLQRIECFSRSFIARPLVASPSVLTYLQLVQPEEQLIHMEVGSLPASGDWTWEASPNCPLRCSQLHKWRSYTSVPPNG